MPRSSAALGEHIPPMGISVIGKGVNHRTRGDHDWNGGAVIGLASSGFATDQDEICGAPTCQKFGAIGPAGDRAR